MGPPSEVHIYVVRLFGGRQSVRECLLRFEPRRWHRFSTFWLVLLLCSHSLQFNKWGIRQVRLAPFGDACGNISMPLRKHHNATLGKEPYYWQVSRHQHHVISWNLGGGVSSWNLSFHTPHPTVESSEPPGQLWCVPGSEHYLRSRPPYVRISTKLFYERKFNSGFLS